MKGNFSKWNIFDKILLILKNLFIEKSNFDESPEFNSFIHDLEKIVSSFLIKGNEDDILQFLNNSLLIHFIDFASKNLKIKENKLIICDLIFDLLKCNNII